MIIEEIKVGRIIVPLKKPFKTKHGVYNYSNEVVVKIFASNGMVGIGSAASAPRVTGETENSIVGAIKHIAENIKGLDLTCFQYVLKVMDDCIKGNNSAKAAVEIAIYDLWSKHIGIPLYKLLGGFNSSVITDMTIMDDAKMENMVNADLDTIIYFADDPIVGGVTFEGNKIMLPEDPGLGIKEIRGWEEIL